MSDRRDCGQAAQAESLGRLLSDELHPTEPEPCERYAHGVTALRISEILSFCYPLLRRETEQS